MTTQREIDREPKLVQAQESIDANVDDLDDAGTVLANIQSQQAMLELTDRQVRVLREWYGV